MKKWIVLVIFGIAFGFVESSVVFYLRQLLNYNSNYPQGGYNVLLNLGIISFILPNTPLLKNAQITNVEMIREFATIIMLFAISYISAEKLKQRIGAFLITFAVWDFSYYLFLYLIAGWPKSFFDLDIFFLIPLPWIGPVATPIILSILIFIIGSRLYLKK